MMCRCHNYGSVEANIITPKVLCMALLKVYKLAAGVGDIDLRDRCHVVNTVALRGCRAVIINIMTCTSNKKRIRKLNRVTVTST